MPPQHDLAEMLATLTVDRRPGVYTLVTGEWPDLSADAEGFVREAEGVTWVVSVEAAERAGAPVGFRAAWLTLGVWSALDAVGLTAAVSAALASEGIACNVLAGFHHDHLLVPEDRAPDAIRLLEGLSSDAAE